MLRQGLAFKGYSIEASDGRIGVVSDFLFDETSWKLRWLVVDAGSWLTGRKLLLHPSSIEKVDTDIGALLVSLTRAQVEKSPGIETDAPVSWQMEQGLFAYYGVDPLWSDTRSGAPAKTVTAVNLAAAESPARGSGHGDPHLRSLLEVTGYIIEATDGTIGHVESFLIDDVDWDVRYLAADTSNWWFGRHVLLAPASVSEICWDMRRVRLNLTGYKIKGSPPWDSSRLLDRAYEGLLHAWYDWPTRYLPAAHTLPPAAAKVADKVAS